MYLSEDIETALRQDIRRALTSSQPPRCDDAYRAAQHVELDVWRRLWNQEVLAMAPQVPDSVQAS